MFNRFLQNDFIDKVKQEINPFIDYLRVGTDREMGECLAAVSTCRYKLKISNTLSRPFPDAAFFGEVPVEKEIAEELLMYDLELNDFRIRLLSTHQKFSDLNLTATPSILGFNILLFSFRTLLVSHLFASGRIMWKELVRGSRHYPAAFVRLNENMTYEDAEKLWIIPNLLAPRV